MKRRDLQAMSTDELVALHARIRRILADKVASDGSQGLGRHPGPKDGAAPVTGPEMRKDCG